MNALILVVILALVEGITEFLPVSSTGHMILVNKLIGGEYLSPTFTNSFLIIIQLGAILSVVVYFWKDLTPFVGTKEKFVLRFRLWVKIIVGVIPAMVIGLFLDDIIDKYFMDNVTTIAITLIVYGIIFIAIEVIYKIKNVKARVRSFSDLKYSTALFNRIFSMLSYDTRDIKIWSNNNRSVTFRFIKTTCSRIFILFSYTNNVWSNSFKVTKKWFSFY